MTKMASTPKGIVFSIIAGASWGLAFIIPAMLVNFSSFDITVGRYFMYGLYSLTLFLFYRTNPFKIRKHIWYRALLYAFLGNVGYFFFLVLAIKHAGATATTLILGMVPIVISLVGNLIYKEFPFKIMLFPASFLLVGVFFLSYGELVQANSNAFGGEHFWLGILYALIALSMWTAYGISNGKFLRKERNLSAELFATLIGIQTFTLVLFAIILASFLNEPIWKRIIIHDHMWLFLIGISILGVFASWVATWAWNHASENLTVSLAGMLLSFETIFGLIYTFIYYQSLPIMTEWVSIIFILAGILFGIWRIYHYKFTLQ